MMLSSTGAASSPPASPTTLRATTRTLLAITSTPRDVTLVVEVAVGAHGLQRDQHLVPLGDEGGAFGAGILAFFVAPAKQGHVVPVAPVHPLAVRTVVAGGRGQTEGCARPALAVVVHLRVRADRADELAGQVIPAARIDARDMGALEVEHGQDLVARFPGRAGQFGPQHEDLVAGGQRFFLRPGGVAVEEGGVEAGLEDLAAVRVDPLVGQGELGELGALGAYGLVTDFAEDGADDLMRLNMGSSPCELKVKLFFVNCCLPLLR